MAETASPLKHFVLAKKAITAIFEQLLEFVTEGSHFVEATYKNPELDQVAVEDDLIEIQRYKNKLSVIGEVLSRRHMKVAFLAGQAVGRALLSMPCCGIKSSLVGLAIQPIAS